MGCGFLTAAGGEAGIAPFGGVWFAPFGCGVPAFGF
jgi:hypothetical protein